MKKILLTISILLFTAATLSADTPPDFSMVGYATLNGGTTGGAGGKTVTPTTWEELKAYAEDATTPYIIRIDREINTGIPARIEDGTGKITTADDNYIETTYGEILRLGSNKSLIGVGDKAFFNRIGIVIQCNSNIIIRNIRFTMQDVPIDKSGENKIVAMRNGKETLVGDPDCIAIQADATSVPAANRKSYNIWVDHCEFYNHPKSTEHKDRYDGLLDIKNNTQYVTISWCHFHDHSKSCLFGSGDSDKFDRTTTLHHNFFENIQGSRLPLLRYGRHHYYNNYMYNCADGLDPRTGSNSYIEACYFEDCKKPICDADGGNVTQLNNQFKGCKNIPTGEVNIDNAKVSKYFDYTPADFNPADAYTYTPHQAADIPELVRTHAGTGKLTEDELTSVTNDFVNTNLHVSAGENNVLVKADQGSKVRIFSANGSMVSGGNMAGEAESFNLNKKGVYVVQVQNGTKSKSVKVRL